MDRIHPLRAFREQQDPPLSQDKLAGMLGVSRVAVTRWELGQRNIDAVLIPIIVEKTGIAPAVLRPDLARIMCGSEKRR